MQFSAEVPVPFVEAVHSCAVAQLLSAEAVTYIFEVLCPFGADLIHFAVGFFDIGPQHLFSLPEYTN